MLSHKMNKWKSLYFLFCSRHGKIGVTNLFMTYQNIEKQKQIAQNNNNEIKVFIHSTYKYYFCTTSVIIYL